MHTENNNNLLRIGIIGGGFTGTALTATLQRFSNRPLEIYLFEKTGSFGAGNAYSTSYPHHLLNARARDMSAFEDLPAHFSEWLAQDDETPQHIDKSVPISEQFIPRFLYRKYLQDILTNAIKANTSIRIHKIIDEVVDIIPGEKDILLIQANEQKINVDKVVLATGVNPPSALPFRLSEKVKCITNPWNYEAVGKISPHDSVLIVGTGLSMIDAVLTLHDQQHQGKINAVSRRGLLPLPHTEHAHASTFEHDALPNDVRSLTKHLRGVSETYMARGGDWRCVINALRHEIPMLWQTATMQDKKQFLRHVLPYWNIHRHRVNCKIFELLDKLSAVDQLTIYAGRVREIVNNDAHIKLRGKNKKMSLHTDWIINCMGPSLEMAAEENLLLSALIKRGILLLDELRLGFASSTNGALKNSSGHYSNWLYTLGPPAQSATWESFAVPEIRKQCTDLTEHLLK